MTTLFPSARSITYTELVESLAMYRFPLASNASPVGRKQSEGHTLGSMRRDGQGVAERVGAAAGAGQGLEVLEDGDDGAARGGRVRGLPVGEGDGEQLVPVGDVAVP